MRRRYSPRPLRRERACPRALTRGRPARRAKRSSSAAVAQELSTRRMGGRVRGKLRTKMQLLLPSPSWGGPTPFGGVGVGALRLRLQVGRVSTPSARGPVGLVITGLGFRFVGPCAGNGIASAEPTGQVDIRAVFGTERTKSLGLLLAADGTGLCCLPRGRRWFSRSGARAQLNSSRLRP